MQKKVKTSIRIDARVKGYGEEIARREHRSFINLIETMIIERCERHGLKLSVESRSHSQD
jgi:hypothetical protein